MNHQIWKRSEILIVLLIIASTAYLLIQATAKENGRLVSFDGIYKSNYCCRKYHKYRNPVIDSNHPDPGVLKLPNGKGFAMVSTSNGQAFGLSDIFPILYSPNLIKWETVSYVFPAHNWPKWSFMNMWAPEIHYVNNRFLIYFTARSWTSFLLCIGVAYSVNASNPFGPYRDLGKPLVEGHRGVIDPHWFMNHRDGSAYLLWTTESTILPIPFINEGKTEIVIRKLRKDGLGFSLQSSVRTILRSDRPEENGVVEGAWLVYKEPFYYLFYSSNWFYGVNYNVGIARSQSLLANIYEKSPQSCLNIDRKAYDEGKNITFVSPGHGSVVTLEDKNETSWWFVYHAWRWNQRFDYPPGRVLNVDKIHWRKNCFDGTEWPIIGPNGHPSDTPQVYPFIKC